MPRRWGRGSVGQGAYHNSFPGGNDRGARRRQKGGSRGVKSLSAWGKKANKGITPSASPKIADLVRFKAPGRKMLDEELSRESLDNSSGDAANKAKKLNLYYVKGEFRTRVTLCSELGVFRKAYAAFPLQKEGKRFGSSSPGREHFLGLGLQGICLYRGVERGERSTCCLPSNTSFSGRHPSLPWKRRNEPWLAITTFDPFFP